MRKSLTHLKDVSRLMSTTEHNGGTCQGRNSHLQALLKAFQPSQQFTLSNPCIPRRQRSTLISKLHKSTYSTATRTSPRLLNVLNLTDRLSLANLDQAISSQHADKAWTLFITLSNRGDNIPLTMCCSLYALLVFAKSMLCRGTMADTRQRQMNKLLDYVQQQHQQTAGLFLPSIQPIAIPIRKEIAKRIRFGEIEEAWRLFFRAHEKGIERVPRNLCIQLMLLVLKDKTLTQNQLNHRMRTIALHGAGKVDDGDRSIRGPDVLRIAYIYEQYQKKRRDASHRLIDAFVEGIPKKKLKNRADALEELIWGILLNEDLEKAHQVINTISERHIGKVHIKETIYISLMEAYRKRKNYHQALTLFEQFLQSDRQPSLNVFNTVLRIFASQKEHDQADYIFGTMLKLQVEPDVTTFTEMIRAYSHTNDYNKCLFFYNKMLSNHLTPDVYTYSALMDASAYQHDIHGVLYWFQTMLNHQIEPNKVIISLILKSLLQQRNKQIPDMSRHITDEAMRVGIKPDTILYTILLKLQAEWPGLENALKVHKEMMDHWARPNTFTYTTLIHACGKHNAPETAEMIFKLMKKSQHKPNTATYTALIHAWTASHQPHQANKVVLDFLNVCQSDKTGRLWIDEKISERLRWCTFC